MATLTARARRNRSGRPEPGRLKAAVDFVAGKLKPDQIILFGSGARGELREDSDFDLLVIREHEPEPSEGRSRARRRRWTRDAAGRAIDVLVMSRSDAESGRQRAGDVRLNALADGRTVFSRPGATLLKTGEARLKCGGSMVRKQLYEPEKYAEFLDQARRKLRTAAREEHPADQCEALQVSMERALKALMAANGMRVAHTHDLNELWTVAEQGAIAIPQPRDEALLEELTRYAGEWQYDNPPEVHSAETWERAKDMAEGLLEYAEKMAPAFARETLERRRAAGLQTGNADG